MNGILRKIKQIRQIKELTQPDMADKLSISPKAYQNFENGVTKMDFERLKQVSEILEIEIEDLINAEDNGVYIAEIKNNKVGYNGSSITINESESGSQKQLFEEIIASKDQQIKLLTQTNDMLTKLLAGFKERK